MLQAQQIVTLACQIAKCPGYTSQAGQYLNAVLESLAIKQNLDSIRRSTVITTNGGGAGYSLPLNFQRARKVYYNVNGQIFTPTEYDYEDYLSLFQGPIDTNYPYLFAVDMSPQGAATPSNPMIYFYPTPNQAFDMNVLYQDTTVTISTPETSTTVPWFIDDLYLIKAVAGNLMELTDDARRPEFMAMSDAELRDFLKLNNGNVLKTVKLDPRSFRSYRNFPPEKLLP